MRWRLDQRGDTLIEVMLATVVLTIVLAGAYTIANRSTRINQTSVERTEVANQLAEQAEVLRAMRDLHDGTAASTWSDIVTAANASTVTTLDCTENPATNNAFYLSLDPGSFGEPNALVRGGGVPLGQADDAYPGTDDIADVWIVAQASPNDTVGSTLDDQYEFHIRGCWEGIGGVNDQRSEIIFRLRA